MTYQFQNKPLWDFISRYKHQAISIYHQHFLEVKEQSKRYQESISCTLVKDSSWNTLKIMDIQSSKSWH